MSVLFFHPSGCNIHVDKPKDMFNDKFVLSKGHAAPILCEKINSYLLDAAYAEAGHIKKEDLMNLRKITSDLEGHPTPRLDFVDVATGSLG